MAGRSKRNNMGRIKNNNNNSDKSSNKNRPNILVCILLLVIFLFIYNSKRGTENLRRINRSAAAAATALKMKILR